MQTAFDVLNDSKKRELYDRYGSDYESFGGSESYGGGGAPQGWPGGGGPRGPHMDINIEDLLGGGGGGFAALFKNFSQRGKKNPQRPAPTRGTHIEQELTVPFTTAVLGGEAQIAVRRPDGHVENIQVKIPAGIESGKKIRLRDQGNPSSNGGATGDILIQVLVAPHPHFRRHGNRLDVRVPIALTEALAGAKIDVPTPHGTISLIVPAGASSGSKLRVKGHGIKKTDGSSGDLFAELQIVLPANLDDEDRQQLRSICENYREDPRADLQW